MMPDENFNKPLQRQWPIQSGILNESVEMSHTWAGSYRVLLNEVNASCCAMARVAAAE